MVKLVMKEKEGEMETLIPLFSKFQLITESGLMSREGLLRILCLGFAVGTESDYVNASSMDKFPWSGSWNLPLTLSFFTH